MVSSTKVRVGVIGAGYFGNFHLKHYSLMDEVKLEGVVDIMKEKAVEMAYRYNIRAYDNPLQIMDKVDAVSIVVPTKKHYQLAKEFLSRGVNVLVEKPLTETIDEAEELVDIARSKGALLQVGHLERFNPAFIRVKDQIKRPLFIEAHRLSTFVGRGIDVDVILDLMIHDLDLILYMVESEVKSVNSVGIPILTPKVDIANVRIEFYDGCVANITASRISQKTMRKIRIFQSDAYFSLDFASREATVIKKETPSNTEEISTISTHPYPANSKSSLREELTFFIKSIIDNTPPMVSGEDGINVLKVIKEITSNFKNPSI
ncbi:MAG: Gfo/Idh/MocA family oxidoreductase [Thermodesulfobacteriota bacterium]|nr:Gfo/Idh/MocA family oxidoreductase [Thermodesulfobacteriota bacterium]